MDSGASHTSRKKRKGPAEERSMDRLENLPDGVFLHILYFLTTIQVIRSSLVSKRFLNISSSVANIDLEYEVPNHIEDNKQRRYLKRSFLEFVDKTLSLHNKSPIRRLRLAFSTRVDDLRLYRWICAVTSRKVEYINLNLKVDGDSGLPLRLFTCNTLVVLKLNLKCTLETPTSTCLPNLEKLRLSEVEFYDDQTVERLFSNCPVIKKLTLVECNWDNIQNAIVFVPTLSSLTIEGDPDSELSDTHVKIVATSLGFLNFSSHLDVDFELGNLSSLVTASIHLPYEHDDDREEVAARARRLFYAIHNVKYLGITSETFEYLKDVEAFLDHVPIFCNMTCLAVNSKFKASCSVFLLAFLGKMPKLEHLDLNKGSCDDGYVSLVDDLNQERVPSCFKTSLKTISFRNFHARQHEMVLLEYVLRHATGLESLSIICSILLQEERLSEAKDRLLNVPRGSQSCEIDFSS